ncbi:hypothetical protein DFH09DRAFT_1278065 [Mycena vulgaris]|nr:hypothetical protein DFH09DRAFT_1278065 [Mycena vulgaris]
MCASAPAPRDPPSQNSQTRKTARPQTLCQRQRREIPVPKQPNRRNGAPTDTVPAPASVRDAAHTVRAVAMPLDTDTVPKQPNEWEDAPLRAVATTASALRPENGAPAAKRVRLETAKTRTRGKAPTVRCARAPAVPKRTNCGPASSRPCELWPSAVGHGPETAKLAVATPALTVGPPPASWRETPPTVPPSQTSPTHTHTASRA